MNINELSNEELILLFIENDYSLIKLERSYDLGKSSMERLFKKREIDYNTIRREHANEILKEYELNPNVCLNCGKPLPYKERNKTFCNKSCSASYNNKLRTKEIYKKVSDTLKLKYENVVNPEKIEHKKETTKKEKEIYYCQWWGKPIISPHAKKFCSNKCDAEFRTNQRLQLLLSGEYFINPNNGIPDFIRKYLYERSEYKCEKCGYDKNMSALEFHHLNPSEKEFTLDARNLERHSDEEILKEFDKCVLLCSNCHAEQHHPELEISNVDNLKKICQGIKYRKLHNLIEIL